MTQREAFKQIDQKLAQIKVLVRQCFEVASEGNVDFGTIEVEDVLQQILDEKRDSSWNNSDCTIYDEPEPKWVSSDC